MRRILKKKFVVPFLAAAILVGASSFSFKSDFFEIAKQIEIFTTLFKELNMNYVDETNPAELMDSAIKNMLDELDPYTRFLNEQDVEAFKINNSGEYSGIGALIRSYESKLLIVEPYKGYAADKAGLKAGDEIVKIGETKVSDFDDDAGELLKGANNTAVEVTFVRQGETRTATITREGVEVDAVPFYDMIDDKTGYIVLSRFNAKASSQTKSAMQDLKGRGAERLVLDLRGNPGGLLSEAINVTNLFVAKGELIVTTKSKVKKFNQEYRTRNQPEDLEIPLVVLVDGKSASASEIVSGSLQDLDRAVVMGARSFGKGLVQRPLKLTYGTQLKVTISRYYTPSGRCIQSLDYWNRDEGGNAVRNTNFKEFTTRNGRKVWDGGGVMPDVGINSLRTNSLIDALHANNIIFDFATNYYYDHSFDEVDGFTFSDADYAAFKKYVAEQNFTFQTKTEELLEQSINADDSLLGPDVQEKYKDLLLAVNRGKISALDSYRTEIQKSLEDEIITRYFYREGLYKHYLQKDDAILTAQGLLADAMKYKSLLN
ncbi:carboxyl-terminal processing protease [Flagellimonas taeanensis]|jgi:carboxyl-terminal processing protease|uniref:Carboxyl-terminal processing protease n=1 Tax=Flagellimonas taeanensis TaxID=1005926 RepID=A0A1M6Q8B1_9FLAO|nr:S41 family peptidase [Allomuricauda taeanensis]SFB69494.1 carboxyl-terminal processing protease [Allomuricauda taeanensis]SHK16347.1 carboxyl-terminal processing protease [Allomuricauda taeanensis]